jgi:hypothetical protein
MSTAELSNGGMQLTSAVWGNKVFFAGGHKASPYGGSLAEAITPTSIVDIYNSETSTWSVSNLIEARTPSAAASAGGRIFFAGGKNSSVIDIYNINNDSWSNSDLTNAGVVNSAAVANKIFWLTRAYHNGPAGVYNIEIYDVTTQQRSFASTYWPSFAPYSTIFVKDNKLLFVNRIISEKPMSQAFIDIYDLATGVWSIAQLNQSLYSSTIISTGDKIYVAGGKGTLAGKLWTLEF